MVPVTAERADVVADALARAFHDDPFQEWLFPDAGSRRHRAARLFRWEVDKARRKGEALSDDAGTAAALWMAPERWRDSWRDLRAAVPPALLGFRWRAPHLLRCMRAIEDAHPTEPHWYLAVLGSAPEARGTGAARELVRSVLDRCDAEGIGAYLESSKELNLPYYERFGFRVTGEIQKGDMPTLWSMWRDPEPPPGTR
jgi:GNAT superfamily N-acetyltransferase